MDIFFTVLLVALAVFLVYMLCLSGNRKKSDIDYFTKFRYAHRGLFKSPTVPENSLSAFFLAVKGGYGIELDVHLMADGKLAVIHDSSLIRTAGADVKIEELSEKDLQNFTLEQSGEHIPTLKEVLELVDGRVPLLIELKSEGNVSALCSAFISELSTYKGKYCVESFDPRCIAYLKKRAPHVVRGQLAENFFKDKKTVLSPILKLVLSVLVLNIWTKPDFVAYKFEDRKNLPNRIAIGFWKIKGFAWTIKNKENLMQAEKEGYSVIFEGFEP